MNYSPLICIGFSTSIIILSGVLYVPISQGWGLLIIKFRIICTVEINVHHFCANVVFEKHIHTSLFFFFFFPSFQCVVHDDQYGSVSDCIKQ